MAVCRELTKVHEEVVRGHGGRAGRRATQASRRRARWCWSSGPGRATHEAAASRAGLDALRALVEAGAKPRPAARVVAELTGGSANALYRALNE